MSIRNFVFFLVLVLPNFGCTSAGMKPGEDVDTSWQKARVYIPGRDDFVLPSEVKLEKKFPVVVYLHGCTGITEYHDAAWAKFIRDLGFVVVMPDSVARKDRGPSCTPSSYRYFGVAQPKMRVQESYYALAKLKDLSWVDVGHIFLMGHSEGGAGTSRTKMTGYRGAIISGNTCTDLPTAFDFNGIFLPMETAVLSIKWSHDPWFYGTRWDGSCQDKFGTRTNAKHVTLVGTGHGTFVSPQAREAVEQFLKVGLK
jgi:dienelactone hydrolase